MKKMELDMFLEQLYKDTIGLCFLRDDDKIVINGSPFCNYDDCLNCKDLAELKTNLIKWSEWTDYPLTKEDFE